MVGGGAGGFFAAIEAATRGARVTLLEATPRFLEKVRISGGGRCNVTHACFDPRELAGFYPRGGQALIGPFGRFGPAETVAWFESRGVPLKTEPDGRIFPVSDSSASIIGCLLDAARAAGVELRASSGVSTVRTSPEARFVVNSTDGGEWTADRVLLATGGCRAPSMSRLALSFGHGVEPCVPSLFTFHIEAAWLRALAGVSVPEVRLEIPVARVEARGPLLVTHWGLSGPAILKLSAWGARKLHALDYRFELVVDFLPARTTADLEATFDRLRATHGARRVASCPLEPLSARLWERLVIVSGLAQETPWSRLSRPAGRVLVDGLKRVRFQVSGKSLNKDEFVTCGGVRLSEVSFKTMGSRLHPGLHFAGEILDIDGLTGGFNFQAAWTTGWIAGQAMAAPLPEPSPAQPAATPTTAGDPKAGEGEGISSGADSAAGPAARAQKSGPGEAI